jgi:hypothetical protein
MFGWILPIISLVLGALKTHQAAQPAPAEGAAPNSLAGWIASAEAFVQGLSGAQAPDSIPADLADIGLFLSDVATNGSAVGLPAEITNGASLASNLFGKYASVESDYTTDQTALLDDAFAWQQKPGKILALSDVALAKEIPTGSVTVEEALGLD